eukprot:SAG11_NODE_2487_length_3302_cov_29.812051_2_plen_79_part_00
MEAGPQLDHSWAVAPLGAAAGRKRWFFYPPSMTPPTGASGPNFTPTLPISHWLGVVYPELQPAHKVEPRRPAPAAPPA